MPKPLNAADRFENLNFLRLLLAALVALSHSYPLTGNAEPIATLLSTHTGGSIAVEAFFVISGYLVTQSIVINNSLTHYLTSRILRIWPALVCALFISILCARISSGASSNEFWNASYHYFKQNAYLLNGISYTLPGSFPTNHTPSVNGSLWTLPWEVRMYLAVAVLWGLGLLNRALFNITALATILFGLLAFSSPIIQDHIDNQDVPWLIAAFAVGMFAYLNIKSISAGILAAALLILGLTTSIFSIKLTGFLVIASASLIFGFTKLISLPKLKHDISYGVYIYAFPIQQLIIYEHPSITPIKLFIVTIFFVLPISLLSWIFLEKPALRYRGRLNDFIISTTSLCKTCVNKAPQIQFRMAPFLALTAILTTLAIYKEASENVPHLKNEFATDQIWGVFFPNNRTLEIRSSISDAAPLKTIKLGVSGTPLLGRWDGGKHEALGIFDQNTCTFTLYKDIEIGSVYKKITMQCGERRNAQPIAGDWSAVGRTDIGIFQSDTAQFTLHFSDEKIPDTTFRYGDPSANLIAISGDWDQNGSSTIGVWRSDVNEFDLRNSNSAGYADISFRASYGDKSSIPVATVIEGKTVLGLQSNTMKNILLSDKYGAGANNSTRTIPLPAGGLAIFSK